MAGKEHSESRLCSKKSIHRAYTLLKSLQTKKTKDKNKTKNKHVKSKDKETKGHVISKRQLKKLVVDTDPYRTRIPSNEYLILEELRVMMSKHNWTAIHKLFPLCGINITYFQSIRFTYAYLLNLCSPVTNEVHFKNFLLTCINHDIIEKGTLEKLMTLRKIRNFETK